MKAFLLCLVVLLLLALSSLPYGARVAIIDYADEWTKNAGLGEALNVMGITYDDFSARRHIHISSLSNYQKKRVLIIGSMATNNPQVRDVLAMNISVSDIRHFVREGGIVIELMQSAHDEAEVGWLPEELSFSRGDSNTSDMTILQPEHRLLNVPNKITEGHLKLMRLTNVSGGIVRHSGFQVLVAEGETGAQPVIMAAEYGYGEFIFLSLAPDKLCAIGQTSEVREEALRLMQNLVAYATGFNAVDDEGKLMVKSDVEPVMWLESQRSIRSVCFSSDGRFLAAGPIQGGSRIRLWDMKTGTEVEVEGIWMGLEYISFSPDGRYLALSSVAGMKIWDVEARQEVKLPDSVRGMRMHCFSPDGKLLAIQSQDPLDPRKATIELLDVSSGKKLRSLKLSKSSGFSSPICFSPDGEVLVSGNTIWDVATGQILSTFHGQTTAFRFSSDGNILASAGGDGTIMLWDVVTGKDVWKKAKGISGDSFRRPVSFSPDLELVAFACDYDETPVDERIRRRREQIGSPEQVGLYVIKLFETRTGSEVKALAGHTDEITAIDFSPDGKLLASSSRDGNLLLWKITPSAELIASDIATASIIKHQTIIDTKDMEEHDARYGIAESHEALAEIYAELGLESAAADERRLATRIQFSESHYQEYLKKTQQPAIEDYMREIQSQQAVISGKPGSEDAIRAKYLVGKLYQKMHDYQKAINTYQELAREHREIGLSTLAIQAIGTSLFERAKSEFEAGANQAAISSLNEALESKESMSWAAEARRLLADIHLLERDERAALQEYRRLIELYPSSRWVFLQHVCAGRPAPSDANEIVADLERKLDEN